jgi:hypothetical protein
LTRINAGDAREVMIEWFDDRLARAFLTFACERRYLVAE